MELEKRKNRSNVAQADIFLPRRRLAPEDREHQIVQAAIVFFAKHGFEASTRDLARELNVTQPLLYRYFPAKEALVDRVYEEVFVRRWNPEWEEWLADRSASLRERLRRYLKDYARFVLRSEWVRIFIYAGLSRGGINQKYLARLRERHFLVIARELRHEFGIPDPRDAVEEDEEVELVWAMHSSVFYIGVRKWIYEQATPKHLDHLIDQRVDAFFLGVPAVLKAARSG
jgi:AcrR family transcriptional regulator